MDAETLATGLPCCPTVRPMTNDRDGYPITEQTFPEILRDEGYQTKKDEDERELRAGLSEGAA